MALRILKKWGDNPESKKLLHRKERQKSSSKRGSRSWAYPVEVRPRIVKIDQEDGHSTPYLCEQISISRSTIHRWLRSYRQFGVEGIEVKPISAGNTRVIPEVRKRIVAVKRAHPVYGSRDFSFELWTVCFSLVTHGQMHLYIWFDL